MKYKSLSKNYRPVSLTCISCKVLEHIIASHVMKHLKPTEVEFVTSAKTFQMKLDTF